MSLKKRLGFVASVLFVVLTVTATVLAYQPVFFQALDNDKKVYAYIKAAVAVDVLGNRLDGSPYVKVIVEGYNADWITGSEKMCGLTVCAEARADTGVLAAGGIFTAKGEVYLDGVQRDVFSHTARYSSTGDEVPLDYEEPTEEPTDQGDAGDCFNADHDCPMDPIIIPTGANQSYRMTSAANGVLFDARGDGVLRRVAWTQAGTELAFLAIDRNGNGTIDNVTELFGDRTVAGAKNGFAALDKILSHNNDGVIDANDPLFAQLVLWTDRNHNGISEASELQPASAVLTAVGLGYVYAERRDGAGNEFAFRSFARKVGESRTIKVYDLLLKVAR